MCKFSQSVELLIKLYNPQHRPPPSQRCSDYVFNRSTAPGRIEMGERISATSDHSEFRKQLGTQATDIIIPRKHFSTYPTRSKKKIENISPTDGLPFAIKIDNFHYELWKFMNVAKCLMVGPMVSDKVES